MEKREMGKKETIRKGRTTSRKEMKTAVRGESKGCLAFGKKYD